ncbi:hypothetical protein [Vibrio crassostreae]|uniref:hypothetical protein n=1 Tax=Vibrio crassostreae TaxID=246167 RepID=UPI001B306230|nr:hypothetical protein [Vibrio crassostreae]
MSSVLVATLTLFNMETKANEEKYKRAEAFAADLGMVLQSFDKRIFLDGNQIPIGNWDRTWGTTESVVTDMIGKELIARNNSICGDYSQGWRPVISDNDREALVPCNLFNPNKTPFNFSFTGERNGNATDKTIISDWSMRVYHKSLNDFKDNFYLYPVIAQQVKLRTPLKMTGSLKTLFVNRVNDDEITANECYGIGVNCALELRYETSQGSHLGEDSYLRVDGSNAMRNSLVFAVNASAPEKCFIQDTPTTTKEVECGLAFDTTSKEIDVVADELFAGGLRLVDGESAVPAIVTCRDENGGSAFCGVGVSANSASPSSVKAKAYLNSMIANESMQLRNSSGSLVFDVDSSGDLYAKGTIDADGNITTKGDLTSDGNLLVKGNAALNGVMTAGAGVISSTLSTGSTATIGGQLNVAKQSTFSDVVRANKALYVNENVIGYSDVLSTGGDIAAINGNVVANQKITANHGDIVASRGNLVTTLGNITATNGTVNAKSVNAQTMKVTSIKSVGGSCYAAGEVARDSTGNLLSCTSGQWASAGGISTKVINAGGASYVSNSGGYVLADIETTKGNLGLKSLETTSKVRMYASEPVYIPSPCSYSSSSHNCPSSVSYSCEIQVSKNGISGCSGTYKSGTCSVSSCSTGCQCKYKSGSTKSFTIGISKVIFMK